MSSELQTYLEGLRSSLGLGSAADDEVVRELRGHVEDTIADLRSQGLGEDEARRRVLGRLGRPRALAAQFHSAYIPAGWQDALTAAAAFLIVGALFLSHLWNEPLAVLAVATVVVAVTLYGLWHGRPTWFYPWAGLALTLLSFVGYFAYVLLERAAGAASGGFDALALAGLAGSALYFPLALAILVSCIVVASRRDWLDASLMLSPSAPVLVWLAKVHGEGGIEAGAPAGADAALAATFLAMALAVAVFVLVPARGMKLATMCATAAVVLVATSAMSGAETSAMALAGRATLLFGFLLSPAALEALATRQLHSAR